MLLDLLDKLVGLLVLEHLQLLLRFEALELGHLTALDSDHAFDLGVAAPSDVVADQELIDEPVPVLLSDAHLIGEIHRRVEELLVRQQHSRLGRFHVDGLVVQRRFAHFRTCGGTH